VTAAPPTAAQLVARAGRALHGDNWPPALARDLNMNERTLRRIKAADLAGQDYPIAPGALADLFRITNARAYDFVSLAGDLERYMKAKAGT
jgi:hypothetical protein